MLKNKIILNNRIRNFIINERKFAMKQNPLLTADYISQKIGRSKSWLSQVENGRLKSVKTNDLINAFCIIEDYDLHHEEFRKKVETHLDNKIMYITQTEKLGIYDDDDNILNLSEMIAFNRTRDFLRLVGENITYRFNQLYSKNIDDIKAELKTTTDSINSSIIYWINRAFYDAVELFSDEVSIRNLYTLMETCITIYENHCDYYGLNHLNITNEQLENLKLKLDDSYFVQEKTRVKPINEYTNYFLDFDEVVKNFSTEQFMCWKYKRTYIGNDPFPMVINFIKSGHDTPTYKYYKDICNAKGLSEDEYLYIIKQIYIQVDDLYKKYKTSLITNQHLENKNDELYEKNKKYEEELSKYKNLNDDQTDNDH